MTTNQDQSITTPATLNNSSPIVVPAVSEKQFPHLWLKNIRINSNSPSEGMIMITSIPYNAETKEIGPGVVKNTVITDLWSAIANVPEAAIAMQAIIAAIEPLEAWNQQQNLQSQINLEPPINLEEVISE
jgi:hypothetical protein